MASPRQPVSTSMEFNVFNSKFEAMPLDQLRALQIQRLQWSVRHTYENIPYTVIEYMYTFPEKRQDKAMMIFRFDDVDMAQKAVHQAGYRVLDQADVGRV